MRQQTGHRSITNADRPICAQPCSGDRRDASLEQIAAHSVEFRMGLQRYAAQTCSRRPDRMEAKFAAANAIDKHLIVNRSILPIKCEPLVASGKEIAQGTKESAAFSIDNIVLSWRYRAIVDDPRILRFVAIYAIA